VTESNFEKEALKFPKPVLLYFWAEWAGPARAMTPAVKSLANEQAGKLRVGMVNIDNSPTIPMKFDIRAVPALVILKDGKVQGQHTGTLSKEKLDRFLHEKLGNDFAPAKR
jgi:thioredoxin 1